MVNFHRLIACIFFACLSSLATADGGPFPVVESWAIGGQPPQSTRAAACSAYVPVWLAGQSPRTGTSRVSGNTCFIDYVLTQWVGEFSPAGTPGTASIPLYPGPASCPAGATQSGSSCTCVAGLRPVDGQCVASPSCPAGQHEEGGACVPDNCKPNETRVNGVCVPEPPCPAGESRVNGKCVPFKCPSQGTVSDQWYDLDGPGKSSTCLFNGQDKTYCTMTITPAVVAYKDGKPSYYGGYGVYTGGTCGLVEGFAV